LRSCSNYFVYEQNQSGPKDCGDDRDLSLDRSELSKEIPVFITGASYGATTVKDNPAGWPSPLGFFVLIEPESASVSSVKDYICWEYSVHTRASVHVLLNRVHFKPVKFYENTRTSAAVNSRRYTSKHSGGDGYDSMAISWWH